MLLERTLFQLDVGHVPPERAEELGSLGYIQWLSGLSGNSSYLREAMRAYELASPFICTSPAVEVFCRLLVSSTASPTEPLPLKIPVRRRRGGAQARRMSL